MSFGKMNVWIDIVTVTPTKDPEGFVGSEDSVLASVRAYKEDRHGSVQWANRRDLRRTENPRHEQVAIVWYNC